MLQLSGFERGFVFPSCDAHMLLAPLRSFDCIRELQVVASEGNHFGDWHDKRQETR